MLKLFSAAVTLAALLFIGRLFAQEPPPNKPRPRPQLLPPREVGQRQPDRETARAGPRTGEARQQPRKRQGMPLAPFRLTPEQEAQLDLVLGAWEEQSSKIKTLTCGFTMFEYDKVFGDGQEPTKQSDGELKYIAPDKGWYRILEKGGDHWVCNGQAIFEYSYAKKQLIERPLPEEMRGKAISNGPLPFMFGAKAERLKQRYWIRITTPPERVGQDIWLEAHPRYRQDAANFLMVEIILSEADLLPTAMQMHEPNGSRKTYAFSDHSVDNPIAILSKIFATPRTPIGWKRVIEEPPADPPPATPPRGQAQRQRPAAKVK